MEKNDLLKLRKRRKTKKPNFIRQDSHKKKEVKKRWRRPKGLQSKMRLCKRGYKKCPSQGYRSPSIIRGLHSTGLAPVIVCSKRNLEKISKNEGAIIAKSVGMKKRIELVNH
ncbi:50S ribosomal protein L32e, partial [Candidatus Woesearchaeota archaeon]|nr:50S ribosomal protein L32e [Candidatus Woesearchaeota archaeon]